MDTEQQIRLNFLDEAEEYFDLMESNLLGLADTAIESQKIDSILRLAHSIKGGAAMMSFDTLSQVAHRIEDFLKILRVRHASKSIDDEVENLLLQSLDLLRNLAHLNRRQTSGLDSENNSAIQDSLDRTQPIFAKLRSHLGELKDADENALLAQNEDFDPAVLIFEEGIEEVLERFEAQLPELANTELAQELAATAEVLIGFGNMASLDAFVRLCESIGQQAVSVSLSEITLLAEQALKAWRRSHALVLRGSIEKLPCDLKSYSVSPDSTEAGQTFETQEFLPDDLREEFDPFEADTEDLSSLQPVFELETETSPAEFDLFEAEAEDLSGLQSAFELETETSPAEFDPFEVEAEDLSGLQPAFELETETSLEEFDPFEAEAEDLSSLQSVFELDSLEQISPTIPSEVKNPTASFPDRDLAIDRVDKMVRVPASQLKQFNTLFEQLIVDRNSIDLRLEQLQNVVSLMSQRMAQMKRSNIQLKQWYDRASVEGVIGEKEDFALASTRSRSSRHLYFDSLELDRYTDIHLICQEQIETIVQLQEVETDLKLGVQEVQSSARDLHYTTKAMQGNVTRTQMLPFADAVKRFPRVIHDLNLQFNKKVNLKIAGEKTLLDRSVIEALSDPLMHLLRNSFDHGIEDPQIRLNNGKPELGTITIQANNQGTYSIITLSDDGSGIAVDKIRDRLRQMGLSQSEVAQISETELLEFIFDPGFSTAKQVTELSGRGVGMDVVRTNLQEVGGDVRVDTEAGKGTTFTIRIPFTLSILKVGIVEQGGVVFAMPINNIRELISYVPEAISTSNNADFITWNQTEIPLIEIEKVLTYNRSRSAINLTGNPAIGQTVILVVGEGKSSAALKVSRFWDNQESTIRSIDSFIPLPLSVIGSVIFGDGKAIPLVDPVLLIEEYWQNISSNDQSNRYSSKLPNLPANKTILVVDDSINVRRYLSLTLEKAGYLVEQAKDGREAVDKLLGGLAVDGVVCDMEMPRLDGYGVLEEIRERAEFADLPIAMLTSRSNEKHRKLAMNLGASAYFSKPYNEQELLNELEKLIK